jgi:hypothetical protein
MYTTPAGVIGGCWLVGKPQQWQSGLFVPGIGSATQQGLCVGLNMNQRTTA